NGINYLQWNLRGKRDRYPNVERPKKDKEYSGRPVLPGEYSIEIVVADKSAKGKVIVKTDPRIQVSMEDLRKRLQRYDKAATLMTKITNLCDKLRDCKSSIEKVNKLLPKEKSIDKKLVRALGKTANEKLQKFLDRILGKQDQKGIIREQLTILDKLYKTFSAASSPLSGGEQGFNNHFNQTKKMFDTMKAEVDAYLSLEWQDYKAKVSTMNLDPFKN
ncbi:hypothetical protein JYT72_02070, partial [Crocinitomix catalasitica]|nr:hypothetical protein [Crocinitomix catalasitica]